MPTYEYRCDICGHTFEILQSIAEEPLTHCPVCGGNVHRLIGAGAGLIFKGSGFYVTDYRRSQSSEKKDTGSKSGEKGKESDSRKTSTNENEGD